VNETVLLLPLYVVGRDDVTFICHEENQDSDELSKGSSLDPGNLAQPVALLTCIRKISGSKFGRHTDYPD
jgi:hypothetical protein